MADVKDSGVRLRADGLCPCCDAHAPVARGTLLCCGPSMLTPLLFPCAPSQVVALITVEVHARDVIEKLIKAGVSSPNDFEWASQLRFYWDRNANDCSAKQVGSSLSEEVQCRPGMLPVTELAAPRTASPTELMQAHCRGPWRLPCAQPCTSCCIGQALRRRHLNDDPPPRAGAQRVHVRLRVPGQQRPPGHHAADRQVAADFGRSGGECKSPVGTQHRTLACSCM